MTYADISPYLQSAAVYTIGYLFGRRRGKLNARAEQERLRGLAKEAVELVKRRNPGLLR
jgi:hypothetical protein